MPIEIPQFVQYQAPLVPLRGVWHIRPPEGDRFISCEIDWMVTTGATNCVQIQTGNSVVEFSQIAALNIDNSRNGSDVQFLFPDSAYILVVPGYNQGIYPVFTNALTFYVSAPLSGLGDVTVFQILNTIPPPVAIQPSTEQSFAYAQDINISEPGLFQIVAPPTTGTVQVISIIATTSDIVSTPTQVNLQLQDGNGTIIWVGVLVWSPNTAASTPVTVTGLSQRFYNGLYLFVTATNVLAGEASVSVYFSEP